MAVTPRLQIDDKDLAKEVAALQGAAQETVTVAIAAGAANVCTISIQVVDGFGTAKAGVKQLRLYMTSSATGLTVSAVAYSGSIVATTGAILATITAKFVFDIITNASGVWVGSLTDTAKTAGEKVAVVRPDGEIKLSAATVTGSYGA